MHNPDLKIFKNLPQVNEKANIPAGVQKALNDATASLATVKQTVQEQKALIERSLEIERNYERSIELYEKLHNQAEDIGDGTKQTGTH